MAGVIWTIEPIALQLVVKGFKAGKAFLILYFLL